MWVTITSPTSLFPKKTDPSVAGAGYLEKHHPILFNDLVLSGQLWIYLADLNEQARERLSLIVEQMKASEGVTEELKAADQMAWVGAMNSIRNRAEEIILRELIYGEDVA